MAIAAHVEAVAPGTPRWIVSLRWALRAAGCLACAAAILVTPELISEAFRAGAPLKTDALESLLVYRAVVLFGGASLLALAELLPWLVHHPEVLLSPMISGIPAQLLLAACVVIKVIFGPEHVSYTSLMREDGVVEYSECVAYLAAAWVAAKVARGLLRRPDRPLGVLWTGLTVALVLVGFEEISWGQRLFGVQTPELLASNVQGEMSLHNLPWAQHCLHVSYIAVGSFGGLAWALVPARGSARFREYVRWIVPPRALLWYFLPVAVFYALFTFSPYPAGQPAALRFGFLSQYDQEPGELLLSIGFLLFAVQALVRLRGESRGHGP
jgi:hypothetical protein